MQLRFGAWALWLSLLALPASGQSLRIVVLDVDQGAATLFISPSGRTLLVDAGKNGHGERVKSAMARLGVTKIDHLVITHYHEDHYGGADELVGGAVAVAVHNVHDRGDKTFLPADKIAESTFIKYEAALGHRAHHIMRGETIPLDPTMLVTCIASGSAVLGETSVDPGSDENDMSVSVLVQFGDFRYFVGGDIESHTEEKIAARDLVTAVDVYQANHHGSHTSSAVNLLQDMLPTLVVISNGNTTKYKHPRQVTLDNLAGLVPSPVVIQTNKYLKSGEGGNVSDEFIADLEPDGQGGDIDLVVDADGSYVARYRDQTKQFQSKPRSSSMAPAVSIVGLLPNPAGSDRDLEEVQLRNNTGEAIDLTGWFLRDQAGQIWSLNAMGELAAGTTATIRRGGMAMSLGNDGDIVQVLSDGGAVVHSISYGPTAENVHVSP